MARANVGKFEIALSAGWPIWASITYDGKLVATVDARELPDLDYVTSRARIAGRQVAARIAPKEQQAL